MENRILDELFDVLAPAALTATAQALAEADANYRRGLAVFELAVQRARYEADRVLRQFDNVESENRLAARTLEANLEAKLAAIRAAENDLAIQRARRPIVLTQQELAWIATAGADIRAIFNASTTAVRGRKQLIRAVIAEIGLTVHRQRRVAELRIVWQGRGRHRGLDVDEQAWWALARHRRGHHRPGTTLAQHHDDRAIAVILAKQKRRTATGLPFTRARAVILRANHGIPVHQPPSQPHFGPYDDDVVMVTMTEAEKLHGLMRAGNQWRESGLVFTTEFGGPVAAQSAARRRSRCGGRGLEGVGVHTLRHSVAVG